MITTGYLAGPSCIQRTWWCIKVRGIKILSRKALIFRRLANQYKERNNGTFEPRQGIKAHSLSRTCLPAGQAGFGKQLLRGGNFNCFWSSLITNILFSSLEWLARQLRVRVTKWNIGRRKRPRIH